MSILINKWGYIGCPFTQKILIVIATFIPVAAIVLLQQINIEKKFKHLN